jgi:endo-1,4-beta-xylanase
MHRLPVFTALAIGLSLAAATFGQEPKTLKGAARGRFLMGVAVNPSTMSNPAAAALVAQQFDCITPEGAFKPYVVHAEKDKYKFQAADDVVEFARQHNLKIIGHTLYWNYKTPKWMFQNPDGTLLPRERALANLREHINAVAGHLKGKVVGWDVVNEEVDGSPGPEDMKDTAARRAIGNDVVEQAFAMAQAADPQAELYYNDYNIEASPKREKTIRLIRRIKAQGLRIDAVGIQGHWGLDYPSPKLLEEAILAYSAEGVKVNITELDISVLPWVNPSADPATTQATGVNPYTAGLPPEVATKLARQYGDLFQVFVKHADKIERITFWGLDDSRTWLDNFPVKGRTNYPLLWDRQLKAKAAFDSVIEAMQNGTAK